MFFDSLFYDDTKAEGADEMDSMFIECKRELGLGKGHEGERRGWISASYTESIYPGVIEFERGETRAVHHELSHSLMKQIYEALLQLYSRYNDRDITIEAYTSEGARWVFKLQNGHDSQWTWSPMKTLHESKPQRFGWF